MWEGSRKPKDSWGVLGEKHPLLSFSFLSDFDFSLIFSQFFFLLSACPLLLQNHQSPCALHVRHWGSFCANVLSAAVCWLWHFTTLALNLGTRGKEGMRCTGESSSHPTKLVLTQPTSGAAGQQDGGDFRNPTEYLGSSFGQLPCTVIQSQGLTLPWPLLIISSWIAAIAPFQKWADDTEQTAEPKPEFTPHDSQATISNSESLWHASAFLRVLRVSPLKYTNTGLNTALEPSERGHHKAPPANSGGSCWCYEDLSNALFFDTNDNGSFSEDQAFDLRP